MVQVQTMKKNLFTWISAALLLSLAGCFTPEKTAKLRDGELAGSFWTPVKSPVPAYIEFTGDGRMVGGIGKDRFFGPVAYARGKRLRMGPVAATRNPDAKHDITRLFISRIEDTRGYVLDGDSLTLYNEERQPVMKLQRFEPRIKRP